MHPLHEMSLAHQAGQMESIGRNCEFGLVQRHLGAPENVGLLRWAGVSRASLIDALLNRFDGLAEEMTGRPGNPNAPIEKQDWWLTCKRYGIRFHAHQLVAEKTVEQATAAIRPRLRWLANKLLDDIRVDEKLFVFSDATLANPADGADLLGAMRTIGPAWLWVIAQNETEAGPFGQACMMKDGMIGSRVARLTDTGDAITYNPDMWASVVGPAHHAWVSARCAPPAEGAHPMNIIDNDASAAMHLIQQIPDAAALQEMARNSESLGPNWKSGPSAPLIEKLSAGEKLFAYRGDAVRSPDAAWPMIEAIRRYNPNNMLLLVLTDPGRAGQVEWSHHGLIVGYVGERDDAAAPDAEPWMSVVKEASAIHVAMRGRPITSH